jgi:taurine dioxygenase
MAQISIRKITPSVGAQVEGFDPRGEIDGATWRQLCNAFDESGVLVFRDIDLDVAMQHKLVEVLHAGGDLSAVEGTETKRFSYVSNKETNGGAPYGRLLFHSDMMWSDIPNQTPSLYAVEAEQPPVPTTFVSVTHAWSTLPAELKERVCGLRARHESGQQGRGASAHEAELIQPQWDRLRDTVTPVAMSHPRTGQTMLYVCEQQTREIVELPKTESDELLDLLFEHIYKPELVMAHHWRAGDLVIWDNQAIQHGRPFVQGDGPARTLRKIHAPSKVLRQLAKPTYAEAM